MAVAAIGEQDKRLRLQELLASIFAYTRRFCYLDTWQHFPLKPNEGAHPSHLLILSHRYDTPSHSVT